MSKSLRQLNEQIDRIQMSNASPDRIQRATDIYARYWANMSKTKQFKKDDAEQVRAFMSGNAAEYRKRDNALLDRQYSRRTYMGLNNG